jgi:hypothetical protein
MGRRLMPTVGRHMTLTAWTLVTPIPGGQEYLLNGKTEGTPEEEVRRYLDAITNGLRADGYTPQLTLSYTEKVTF